MLSPMESMRELLGPLWQLATALSLCSFPLWWLFAHRSIDPMLKLLLTVLANFTLMYLLELGAYFLSLPQWFPLTLLLGSFIYSVIIIFRDRTQFPWRGLLAWTALALWIIGLQSWIVSYGAASWYGDWYEHYERSIWFLDQQPPDQRFLLGLWSLAARGPLFNSICGMLMNSGPDFASFQVFATALNTFTVLPLALLLRGVAKLEERSALIWSVVLCALAPFAVQQETYTWTKFFTAGILLSGIYLYRLGMTENRQDYVCLSFGIFALAILAHYLAFLFILFFVVHFLYEFRKRKWAVKMIAAIATGCALLLLTWFGYIFARFGIQQTLLSTSTFGEYGQRQKGAGDDVPPWSIVFAGNMVTTTIPYSWRHDWEEPWRGIGKARRLTQRDLRMGERYYPSDQELDLQSEWFADLVTKPNSLLGGIGYAGILGLIFIIIRRIRRNPAQNQNHETASPGKLFWILFCILGIPLNVLASRDYSAIGMAHLNLQLFFLLFAVLLFRELRPLRMMPIILALIFVFESALITGAWISIQQRTLPISMNENGEIIVSGKVHADAKYVSNYLYKVQTRASFLSDKLGRSNMPFFLVSISLSVFGLSLVRRERRNAVLSEAATANHNSRDC